MIVSSHTVATAAATAAAGSCLVHHGGGAEDTACVHAWLVRGVVVQMNLRPILQGEQVQLLTKGMRQVIVAKGTEDAAFPERALSAGLKLL